MTSPLCPAHFPNAEFIGTVLPGLYLGRLNQPTALDLRGARLEPSPGQYGLFIAGPCGDLVALFDGTPYPFPLTEEQDRAVDEMLSHEDDDLLVDEVGAWSDEVDRWIDAVRLNAEIVLPIERGAALMGAARRAGYRSRADWMMGQFDFWLADRAGRIAAA